MFWPDRERYIPSPRYILPAGHRSLPAEYNGRQYVDAFSPPYRVYKPMSSNRIQWSESHEEADQGKSLGKIFRRFAEKTAMQGPGYIRESKKWYAKAAWSILLLTTMGWMTYHLVFLIAHYLEKPVQTTISLGFNKLHFPSVTVCNVNVVKLSDVPSTSKDLKDLIAAGNPVGSGGPPGGGGPGGGGGGPPGGGGGPPDGGQPPPGRRKRNADTSQLHEFAVNFTKIYLELDRATRIRSGHQIDMMLMDCSFNGHKCYPQDFTLINTPEYGNCFTLHSEKFISKEAGPKSGLSFIFFTENDEYVDSISQGYGLRLQVHNPGTFPNPSDKGLSIPTSFHSNIGLLVRDVKRVPPPYRECEDVIGFEKKNGFKYTRNECRRTCIHAAMRDACGCLPPNAEEFYYFINKTNEYKGCQTEAEFKCLEDVETEFKSFKRTCTCLNPCREQIYSMSKSVRQWPSMPYATSLMQTVCQSHPEKCIILQRMRSSPSDMIGYFSKVTIYYEDLNFEELVESPASTFAEFASNIGGAIGLWIGLSVLAMFEVVQLMIELCAYGFYLLCGKKRKVKDQFVRDHERENKIDIGEK